MPKLMDEDKLIVAVQKRSVIYDKEDHNYHNRDIINATWENIAREVGSDGKYKLVSLFLNLL